MKKELSEVKAQLTELKKAFEKMSQQNMQLTMDLATERERIRQLQTEVHSTSMVRGGSDDGTSTLNNMGKERPEVYTVVWFLFTLKNTPC